MSQLKKQCKAITLHKSRCSKSVSEKDPRGMHCLMHAKAKHVEEWNNTTELKHYYRSTNAVPHVREAQYKLCHNLAKNEPECKKVSDVCTWTKRKTCQRAFGKAHTTAALKKWAPEGAQNRWGVEAWAKTRYAPDN